VQLPVLPTPRLVLEPVSVEVARRVLAGTGPEAVRGWPGPDALQAFRFAVEHGGDPGWMLVRDGVVVGECGTHGPPNPDGVVEIRYGIAASERGQGLATESCPALPSGLLTQPGVRSVPA
jgi:RimJ/RimL family protein N-acetyltransferase